MTVKEANNRYEYLKNLSNNLRLIEQYFLNVPEEELEVIAEGHGLNAPIISVMRDVSTEMISMTNAYGRAIEEAEIGDILV